MASRGAYATACTRMSRLPQSRFNLSNAAEISSSFVTSSGMMIFEPSDSASGVTRSFILSFRYVNASSAPSRCMACAMPQAMERSVATPTMRARLPARNPIEASPDAAKSAAARGYADRKLLARLDGGVREIVPGGDLLHRDLEEFGDRVQRVASAHHVSHRARGRRHRRRRGGGELRARTAAAVGGG